MLKKMIIMIHITALFSLICFLNLANAEVKDKSDAYMKMHHLHIMMNQGIIMATEGSSFMMLAEMKIFPSLDSDVLHHGRNMLKKSRPLINRTLSGPVVKDLHKKGYINDPLLNYTHSLNMAMLTVVDMLEKMKMGNIESPRMVKLSNLHNMINHSIEMAAEGSNLSLLGQMGQSGKVMDDFSIEQGNKMMKNARSILLDITQGKTMKELHEKGITSEKDPAMKNLHNLAEAGLEVVDMLIEMPPMDQ
jgi:hypothetical protein